MSPLVHWLVIIALIASTLVAPAQAASDVLQQVAAARLSATVADMPCGDLMSAPTDPHQIPCDCCNPSSCDLSACLGTAYLHALPSIVASIPMDPMHVTADVRAHPSQSPDTPLRPPIA